MINQANATTPAQPPVNAATQKRQDELREAIDQTIGSVFFGPLMKTMRSSVLKGEIGHGGRGEEVFRAQLDQVLVERAGSATRYELSDVLFDRFAPSVKQVSNAVADANVARDSARMRSETKQ